MAGNMGFPLVTEEDFNFAIGFTMESPLEARLNTAREDFNLQYRHLRQADGQDHAASVDGDQAFHLFPRLPAELRLEVWKQVVKNLPVPKVQEFDFDLAYDANAAPEGRAGNGLVACFKPKHNRQLAGHRGLLMACIDSREAFLNSSDYHMLPLTYLVALDVENTTKEKVEKAESFEDYVKKTNATFRKKYGTIESKKTIKIRRVGNTTFRVKKITPQANDVAHKITDKHSQANKAFVRVLLPVSFEHTRFLIDKVAETFAYKSVHPTPPPPCMAFGRAAGLEFVHSIKKLAFSMDKKAWFKTSLFSDLFATSLDQYRVDPNTPPYILGKLEELSYASASAVERQCCIGADLIWESVPTIAVQQFERRSSPSEGWHILDLYRLQIHLLNQWARFHSDFNLRWGGAIRQKCTCPPR
ncbi:hypothetical protein INS49_009664 [Diaporthe citri]|uniref:uncharacterized protein n=1 Tax=Diaporthe citri TaxID=83186 RepID=UPI001C7EC977|nr:uncharacterized protein INS49_009664 [Diaporthe citri]KAG6361437.1 hypothetical protein INS49_009664 [Diaporthe citri]